jgi:parvulin-like peptidyl-prolyl isomerase
MYLSQLAPVRRPLVLLTAVILSLSIATACRRAPAPASAAKPVSADTWAVVDGREITREDVEKAYRRMADPSRPLADEEALAAKLSLLNDLILQDILLAKARGLKVEVAEKDLDEAYAEAKKNVSDDAFEQELSKRNLTTADMREGLRRQLLSQKVVDQEIGSKIAVTDQEIAEFFNANKADFNLPEDSYHLAQIVITPTREPQRTNRTGDDATTPQTAATKAQMLMERLKSGASFGDLAMDYSEDAESAARGGDLGLVPMSRLKQAPVPGVDSYAD